MISDYAVILAILVFASIDNAFHLQTPKLIVPTVFKVTTVQNNYVLNTENIIHAHIISVHEENNYISV